MARRKKKSPPPERTETVDEYLAKGGGIRMLPKIGKPYRLLFSSGHFDAKRNQRRKHVPDK